MMGNIGTGEAIRVKYVLDAMKISPHFLVSRKERKKLKKLLLGASNLKEVVLVTQKRSCARHSVLVFTSASSSLKQGET